MFVCVWGGSRKKDFSKNQIYWFTYNLKKFVSSKIVHSPVDAPFFVFFLIQECMLEIILKNSTQGS